MMPEEELHLSTNKKIWVVLIQLIITSKDTYMENMIIDKNKAVVNIETTTIIILLKFKSHIINFP
jgi:hypothetical protein